MKKFTAFLLTVCAVFAIFAVAAASGCAKKEAGGTKYDIRATYDEEKCAIEGTETVNFFNDTQNELSDLKFNLYGNAFREGAKIKPVSEAYKARAYYAGTSYGSMTVNGVEGCAGWSVGGEDENILTVNLHEPLYPDSSVKLTISYTLALAKVNHRTGKTADAINLGNFYPQLCAYSKDGFAEAAYYPYGDPFVSEIADYTVTFDVPQNFIAATSGKLKSESEAAGRKKCVYTLQKARDFAAVISDKFETVTGNIDGVEVIYYHTGDKKAQENFNAACDSLIYFSRTFGKYVYPTLSVVSTGFYAGGMEYPALTMINREITGSDAIYTIVHENAHQWWYAMVGSDQINEAWQDEGLAEYSTVNFFETHPDYGFTRAGLIGSATRSYRAFFSVYSQLEGTVDTSMSRNLSSYSSDVEYTSVTYYKGVILFDNLRKALGDKSFFKCLKNYYSRNLYKIASKDDICAAFTSTGTDVEGYFAAFTEGRIVI